MAMEYKAPAQGTDSTIGKQLRTDYYYKRALIAIRDDQFFMPLADVRKMPTNMGKKIVQFEYIPLLDDRNVNDQGIDAAGVTIANGNLYGSSKDIGNITSKLPTLSESGGRVNRVGYTRITLEGTFVKFGFFDEYTKDSLQFDTDAQLRDRITTECLVGANAITEAALQADLLNGAGTVRFAGVATTKAEMTGEGSDISEVDYEDIMRHNIDLDNAKCPKSTTMATGTRLIDTRTIDSARITYIGSELIPTLRAMKDMHGNPAFIPKHQYAAGTDTVKGEIGSIDQNRFVVVPQMQHWAGAGATVTANEGYRATAGKYDVFPMLTVGSGSFTTIGFKTNNKTVNFQIIHKKPGYDTASFQEPYGQKGFYSIMWFYGIMYIRPEWIGLIHTVARM